MSLPLKTWMHENPDSRHLCWQKNMGSRDQMRPKHKLRTVTNFKREKKFLTPLKVWVLLQLLYATILKLDSRIHTHTGQIYMPNTHNAQSFKLIQKAHFKEFQVCIVITGLYRPSTCLSWCYLTLRLHLFDVEKTKTKFFLG